MKQRRLWLVKVLCVVAVVLFVPQVARASAYVVGDLVQVSGASPFAANCGLAGQTGTNYPNSEVEPWVDVNPANADNLIGAWQQDRWSNGGSRGNVVGASLDGGAVLEDRRARPRTRSAPAVPRPTAATTSAPPTRG